MGTVGVRVLITNGEGGWWMCKISVQKNWKGRACLKMGWLLDEPKDEGVKYGDSRAHRLGILVKTLEFSYFTWESHGILWKFEVIYGIPKYYKGIPS